MAIVSRVIDFRLGTAAAPNTLTDLSAKAEEASLNREADIPEATTFNTGNARSYAPGLTMATIDATFLWDAVIDLHLKGIHGFQTPISFQHGEIGNATGNPKTTGFCFLQKLDKPQKVGDVLKLSVTFQVTGALNDGVY